MQLEIPENLRPTIYFEDSFKGDKLVEFKSYIAGIEGSVLGYEGVTPNFRNHEQILDFVEDMRMQTNLDRVNINSLDSWKSDVYPILVVDSDGMNPESIFRVIDESINENKIPNTVRAGGYDFLNHFRLGNVCGKFAVIIQCHNLETCKFEGFKDGISLQINEVEKAVLGIEKKKTRKRYGSRVDWKGQLESETRKLLPLLVKNQSQTLMEPDSFNTILKPIFEIQTSSIYLDKPRGKLSEKVVQLQNPEFERLSLLSKKFDLE